jgi:hypothetical protein
LQSIRNRSNDGKPVGEVTVLRNFDGQMPVEILVRLDGGTDAKPREQRFLWDGKARQRTFTVPGRVLWAQVDPTQKVYMDIDFTNNSLTLSPSTAPQAKIATHFLFWVENWMQWLAWLA